MREIIKNAGDKRLKGGVFGSLILQEAARLFPLPEGAIWFFGVDAQVGFLALMPRPPWLFE